MTVKLQDKLVLQRKSSWLGTKPAEQKLIMRFSDEYKTFLNSSKTERLMAANILSDLKKKGFKPLDSFKRIKKGDRFFKDIKGKAIIAGVVGKDKDAFQIVGAHMDSPRLDLKPNPLYEDSEIALMHTHYYGGVKKYQWVNVPLALTGIVFTKSGKKVDISVGLAKDDPVFIIPDLEPHLARKQMEKDAKTVIEGEDLNVLAGTIPYEGKDLKDAVKHLNDKYGMIEEDFNTAELELVPVHPPKDIGFDRSLIGAYGQDDKVCSYAAYRALLDVKDPKFTAIALLVDKEEIGSMGDTGAQSFMLINFAEEYIKLTGSKGSAHQILERSRAVSADVTAALNPTFKDVQDPHNAVLLGKGIAIEKYGGAGGKYSSNDASAEYMSYIRQLAQKNNIPWQTGELGKVDQGGGGTIAMFLSRYGMDCVDAGPCALGLHSPMEVTSKADIYAAFRFYRAFFADG